MYVYQWCMTTRAYDADFHGNYLLLLWKRKKTFQGTSWAEPLKACTNVLVTTRSHFLPLNRLLQLTNSFDTEPKRSLNGSMGARTCPTLSHAWFPSQPTGGAAGREPEARAFVFFIHQTTPVADDTLQS
jgi:hypothetical protein